MDMPSIAELVEPVGLALAWPVDIGFCSSMFH